MVEEETHSYVDDVKVIMKVPSFLWSTFGFLCVSFAVGAFAFWAPTFSYVAQQVCLFNFVMPPHFR